MRALRLLLALLLGLQIAAAPAEAQGLRGLRPHRGGFSTTLTSALVTVPALVRVPIASVTDGGATTADSALILASATARRNARMVTTTAARDFRITLGAAGVTGTGGALLYLDGANLADATFTSIAVGYSTDGGTTFTSAPVTLFAPSGAPGYATRGVAVVLPVLPGGAILRVTYTASAASQAFYLGLVNLDADKRKNAIFVTFGTSVEFQGWAAQATTDRTNALNPAGDVLFFNQGKTGGKIADIYTAAFSQMAATYPFAGYAIASPWMNEPYKVARPVSPYVYAGDTTAAKSDITGGIPQFGTYAANNGISLLFGSVTFADYPANDVATGAPAVDQAGASGGPYPARGNAPWNNAEIMQAVAAASPDSIDLSAGIYRLDGFSLALTGWENTLLSADHVHPSSRGSVQYQAIPAMAALRFMTGGWGAGWVEGQIARYEGSAGMPASIGTRLSYAMSQWPAATTAAQTAARNALATRLAAIPTSYSDPALTGAAVLPTALTGIREWLDFADFDTLTSGQASSSSMTPASFDQIGVIASASSRVSGGSVIEQTTVANTSVRPLWYPRASADGKRGALDFAEISGAQSSNATVLTSRASAPVISLLDAGNVEFTIGMAVAPGTALGKIWLQFINSGGTGGGFRIGPSGGASYGLLRVLDNISANTSNVIFAQTGADPGAGAWLCVVVSYVGGAWTFDVNGVRVGTATYTMPARTGTTVNVMPGSAGKMQTWFIATGSGAGSNANVAAANAYLRQITGAY